MAREATPTGHGHQPSELTDNDLAFIVYHQQISCRSV